MTNRWNGTGDVSGKQLRRLAPIPWTNLPVGRSTIQTVTFWKTCVLALTQSGFPKRLRQLLTKRIPQIVGRSLGEILQALSLYPIHSQRPHLQGKAYG